MKKNPNTRGFTFIEIMVVLAIITIITAITAVSLNSVHDKVTRDAGVNEVFGALTHARSQTLSSHNDTVYGTYISSTTVVRFVGGTYTPGDSSNKEYKFEGSTEATSSIFASGGVSIVFSQLTGIPSATGTILIHKEDNTSTSTVIIHDTGLIEIE